VWSTNGSRTNARVLGEKGYVMATLGTGFATRPLFDAYRAGYVAKGRPAPAADRFGYLGLVAVASNEAKARERGEVVASYLRSSAIVAPQFRNPPGYLSIEDNMRMLRGETRQRSKTKDGRFIDMHGASVQDLIDAAIMFAGTPDQVYDQLRRHGQSPHDGACRPDVPRRHCGQSHPVRERGAAAAQGL
jgi:alkanesulfonate monooxygenase SsuD/methylene tetrahydromethanopterin reductase-like flavin-dependent oxidoreductase (luciferase family)